MADVQPTDVAVTGPPQVGRADVVRPQLIIRPHKAERRRTYQEIVLIKMQTGVVLVVVHTELSCVARPDEILPVKVGDDHLLMAPAERVQAAVGVLLEEMEISEVVLPAVRVQVAKDAHARLLLNEEEPAKVAAKRLDARAHREKVIVGAEVPQLQLEKRLLQTGLGIQPVGAAAHINIDNAELPRRDVVDVDRRCHPQSPVNWPERGVPAEQVQGKAERLQHRQLLAPAEEFAAAGARRAHVAGHGEAAAIEEGLARRGQVEEGALTENGDVALELVAVEGIIPVSLDVRKLASLAVAVPLRHGDVPSVRHLQRNVLERRWCLGLRLLARRGLQTLKRVPIRQDRRRSRLRRGRLSRSQRRNYWQA